MKLFSTQSDQIKISGISSYVRFAEFIRMLTQCMEDFQLKYKKKKK